jgi:hypothetical protein
LSSYVAVKATRRKPMATRENTATPFEHANEIFPTCTITPEQVEQQEQRHRRLRPATESVERADECVEIQFNENLERETLDALIAVENDCCPFLIFRFDEEALKLRVGVDAPEHALALDAMAEALGGRAPARTTSVQAESRS